MIKIIFISFLVSFSAYGFNLKKIEDKKIEKNVVVPEKNINKQDNISDLVQKEECKKNEHESEEACKKYLED